MNIMNNAFSEFEATVVSIKDPLPDHRIIRFKLDKKMKFTPGQFVQVLIEDISKPASFSIASSPEDDEIELAYHKVGRVTGAMSMMIPGTKCKLRGPLGRFTFSAEDGDIVCLAGGVGVTPFVSIARFIHDLKLPNKYDLILSAKTKEGLLYYDVMEALIRSSKNIHAYYTITGEIPDDWQFGTRRIDAAMIKTQVPDYISRTYYLCGPKVFIEAMIELLKEIGIEDNKIRRELW